MLDNQQKELTCSVIEVGDITTYYLENLSFNESLLGALFSHINYQLENELDRFIEGYIVSEEQFKASVMAIEYFLDFKPQEKIIVSVEYNYGLTLNRGGYFGKSSIEFRYLLSPAKYWNSFQDLSIYLTLTDDYSTIKYSTIPFERDGNSLTFHSDCLPETELLIIMERSATNMACSFN